MNVIITYLVNLVPSSHPVRGQRSGIRRSRTVEPAMEPKLKIVRPARDPELLSDLGSRAIETLQGRDERLSEQLADLAAQTKRNTALTNKLNLQVKGIKADLLELKKTDHSICALLEDIHTALKANIAASKKK